jgi:leader peptidase (prepilin peptidase) / N-methyltransferase
VSYAAFIGALFGSFLNVVAYRLPKGESLSVPRSRCPGCETPIKPYDNVPVLSWLLLRGRCRDCGVRIAARYPIVEAGTALLLAAVVAVHLEDTTPLALGLVLVLFLVPMAIIDLDHQIIPNKLTAPAAVIALVLGTALDPSGQPERLIAGLAAAAFLLLAALMRPGGMGMGDVKLAAVLGFFLGGEVAVALLVALISGTLVGGVIMARVGVAAGRKTKVPFGPFLALGGVVAVLAGTPILDAYLGTFG